MKKRILLSLLVTFSNSVLIVGMEASWPEDEELDCETWSENNKIENTAKERDVDEMLNLGNIYKEQLEQDNNNQEKYEQAIELYEKAANEGSSATFFNLWRTHYEKAANEGHLDAMLILGVVYRCHWTHCLYNYSHFIDQELFKKAIEWYEKAAKKSAKKSTKEMRNVYTKAILNLGQMHKEQWKRFGEVAYEARDLEPLKKAVEWFEIAAKEGHLSAYNNFNEYKQQLEFWQKKINEVHPAAATFSKWRFCIVQ